MDVKFLFANQENKTDSVKKSIIRLYIEGGPATIAEMAGRVGLSIPTTTKVLAELADDGFVSDFGKQETEGGRRPNLYGLKPDSGLFVGVNVSLFHLDIALLNLEGSTLVLQENIPYKLEDSREALLELCTQIKQFISAQGSLADQVLGVGLNITGRVNASSGYSYSYFYMDEQPLVDFLREQTGYRCFIDNDTRAMAYGEFKSSEARAAQNLIFVNIDWGIGIGIIVNGLPYYGKSGFAGEFGHFSLYENELICRCGKKGCLETEASGFALQRVLTERIKAGSGSVLQPKLAEGGALQLEDIIQATLDEDVLAIEAVEEIGYKLGKALAGLINIFNPEQLVLGGLVALCGDYILLPVKTSINKFSINLINKDTEIRLSKLGHKAGVVGVALLARDRILAS
ncbi:ROK family transcriptional regulator [Mangrovibacterium diazotrophicum]|uniref:Putative NBD/HSP70 family sugar kinase n=1 Tax=Mangrovibacterium diazotrophicum TaxID=1261403 RepID=A0A419WAI1_9BACT|nr:ROK family transcriptional regulator [Mangrovibacterium diazotrophicum]RKD92426.1 putative NBD/HSP70 family sugar kinase [Mangrovibacterium diazotrophicum]